jgi:hypothetical protein
MRAWKADGAGSWWEAGELPGHLSLVKIGQRSLVIGHWSLVMFDCSELENVTNEK